MPFITETVENLKTQTEEVMSTGDTSDVVFVMLIVVVLWAFSKIGLVKNLRWVNNIRIQQTLVKNDKQLLLERIRDEFDEGAQEVRHKLEEMSKQFEGKAAELAKAYRELKVATEERRQVLLLEIKELRKELQTAWKNWVSLTELTEKQYALA